MGKAYSTQLKVRNSTSSRITTCVSRIKPKQWIGPNRPDNNFHNVGISPGSDYSREESINLRSPVNAFTLLLSFDDGKRLEFRIDQGRVAGKKRCRCRSKDKNKFVFIGDDAAFDVKDTISGNTLTIEIKDSYMYKFSTDEAKKKAEVIAMEQAKAAAAARVRAEEERRAVEADKARKEEKAREEEAARARDEEERRGKEETDREAERVAHRVADAKREREETERVDERKVKADERDGASLEAVSQDGGLNKVEQVSKDVEGNVRVETSYVVFDEPQLRISGEGHVADDNDDSVAVTSVRGHVTDDSEGTVTVTSVRLPREASSDRKRRSSEVTVHVTVDQRGDIRVQIEEVMEDGNTSASGDEAVFIEEAVFTRHEAIDEAGFTRDDHQAIQEAVHKLDQGSDAREGQGHTGSSQVIKRAIETHF